MKNNGLFRKVVPAGVGVVVRNSDGHFLLGKRIVENGYGFWSTPGGFLEPGESLEKAAKREVLEETGLTIKNTRYLGAILVFDQGETFFDAVIEAEVDDLAQSRDIIDRESESWEWLSKEDIENKKLWKPAKEMFKFYFKHKEK